jgi:hypothetical protein
MKADIKQKWVAALLSNQYEQTTGALRDGTGYCCLGVLCDLYSQETGVEWFTPNEYDNCTMHGNDSLLPLEVRVWAGLAHDIGGFVSATKHYDEGEETTVDLNVTLTELNDSFNYDFKMIAEVIEEQL